MALTITVEFNGIVIPGAYCRVNNLAGTKELLSFSLQCYKDQESYEKNYGIIKERSHSFKPSVADGAGNFIKQAYEYLKSLPEYQNSIDA